eukprot:CAMPEP_0170204012 /NCGR_PEP_ID=MMETSP0116_2-20130129/1521_1 /TAXON_ID=400756 /ORGANISM="Durinskia baltica, Strain CSIRO CS-38" /LENGTH=34 /DNA_ID= /DNA_START= /DNA_END= /DNA_ORIENTATION=
MHRAVQKTDGWARLLEDKTAATEVLNEIVKTSFP